MAETTAPLLVRLLIDPVKAKNLTLGEWDLLVRQARSANVLPRLGFLLRKYNLWQDIPEQPLRHLESARIFVEQFENTLKWEIRCIQKALQALNIPVVYLKGAAYFITGHDAAKGRIFSDVDILVSKDRIEAVEQALRRAGWAQHEMDDYDLKYYRDWMHESPPMEHVVRGTSLDVHHNILPQTNRICPDAAKLAANAEQTVNGLWVLSFEDRILHSAAHLFHEGELDNGLRDLSDLQLIFQELGTEFSPAWQKLLERAEALGLQRPLFYAMRYCHLILDCDIPQQALRYSKAWAPHALALWLLDRLFLRGLMPNHPSCDDFLTKPARLLLFIRSHWLKMPVYLLIPHLLHKSRKNFSAED